MERVKYVLIGFGGIAENKIAREGFGINSDSFTAPSNACLIGACDLNPVRRQAIEATGIKYFDCIEEVLSCNEVDAVFIATNNSTHAPLIKKDTLGK